MATQKELDATMRLVGVAAKVNASSDRIDVTVDIDRARVTLRISDPVTVRSKVSDWDWLFYDDKAAYFSGDVFSEDAFLERCQEFIDIVNGFEGYAAAEVA